ncbi:MAG: fumarylacetoacetate hydrolase family protein [Burkholderiales bacterium]
MKLIIKNTENNGRLALVPQLLTTPWEIRGLAQNLDRIAHRVVATRNGSVTEHGRGANALGDPRIALTWIANELCAYDKGLQKDDIVTTGTCIVPMPIASGDLIRADFGKLGDVEARID